MISRQSVAEFFGVGEVLEVLDSEGVVLQSYSNPSEFLNFYGIEVSVIGGNPIEYPGGNVTKDCRASTLDGVLYVVTSGIAVEGSLLIEIKTEEIQ